MQARIYRPAKNPMQSGRANTQKWVLEYEPASPRRLDPLMGWTSSSDTRRQVRIKFDTKEEAVAFAQKRGLAYTIDEPQRRQIRPKVYADNFRYDRKIPWTH
jgi:hypothetical protein